MLGEMEVNIGAPVSLIRGGHEGLRVADEGVRCVPSLSLLCGVYTAALASVSEQVRTFTLSNRGDPIA